MRSAIPVLLAVCSLACASTHTDFGSVADASGDDGGSLDGGSLDGVSFVPMDAGPTSGCTDAAKLIYLVSQQNGLYSFDPKTLLITPIGKLDCPSMSTPYDMAIDHDAHAYVVMADGTFFQVDTATAHCTATSYTNDNSGYGIGATAFAADGNGGETLYTSSRLAPVSGACPCGNTNTGGIISCFPVTGRGLARVDLGKLTVAPIGLYGSGLDAQILALTGTGDGRLFGFYANNYVMCDSVDAGAGMPPGGAEFVELDKGTGGIKSTTPLSNVQGGAWAFSFWGGDFWFYSADTGNSQVTRYKYATDKSFSVVVPDTGMTIVGAGVSTCAPVTPPN